MKIKRYFAPDIRTAIRMVREQQGPDAVILSNRKVDGGVEIVAAVDYDEEAVLGRAEPVAPPPVSADMPPEGTLDGRDAAAAFSASGRSQIDASLWTQEPVLADMRRELNTLRGLLEEQLSGLAWGEMARTQPQRAGLLRRLRVLGFGEALAARVVDQVGSQGDPDLLWRRTLGVVAHALPVKDDDILSEGGVIALLGPTGVGKTTMVAKLAARFCLRHGPRQVALVTTDNYRIGAHDQLRTYGRILDVPVRVIEEGEDPRRVIEGLADRRIVLVDTAGMGQRDQRLAQHLTLVRDGVLPLRRYLVLSAATHRSGLREIIRHFGRAKLAGCMLTKVDEATRLGDALSAIIESRLPVAYVGNGQRVPEDLALARAHNLVSLAVAIAQQGTAGEVNQVQADGVDRVAVNGEP